MAPDTIQGMSLTHTWIDEADSFAVIHVYADTGRARIYRDGVLTHDAPLPEWEFGTIESVRFIKSPPLPKITPAKLVKGKRNRGPQGPQRRGRWWER